MSEVSITVDHEDSCQVYSKRYGDIYFNPTQGKLESDYVFFSPNQVLPRLSDKFDLTIVETGFGSGLNFFLLLEKIETWLTETRLDHFSLTYFSFDRYKLSSHDLDTIYQKIGFDLPVRLNQNFNRFWEKMNRGWNHHSVNWSNSRKVDLRFFWGEVSSFLSSFREKNQSVDVWFLDGFAPSKNPEMWEENLFDTMRQKSRSKTTFSTFTAAGKVRRLLEKNCFKVDKVKGFGSKKEMLTGLFFP